MEVRKKFAYGSRSDYFAHKNCIGFIRRGKGNPESGPNRGGCAVLITNADAPEQQRRYVLLASSRGYHAEEKWCSHDGAGSDGTEPGGGAPSHTIRMNVGSVGFLLLLQPRAFPDRGLNPSTRRHASLSHRKTQVRSTASTSCLAVRKGLCRSMAVAGVRLPVHSAGCKFG